MDPDLIMIATTTANALIGAMTTDAWAAVKAHISKIMSRGGKASQATQLDRDLEETRTAIYSVDPVIRTETIQAAVQHWQRKLLDFLADYPDAGQDLRSFADSISVAQGSSFDAKTIRIEGKAEGTGRVYQQGQGNQFNA